MIKKRIFILALCSLCIIGVSVFILHNYGVKANEIKLIDYRASEEFNEQGYQIDKYEGQNVIAWLNENEVLTATEKDQDDEYREYFSIYNVNTKESKKFEDMSSFYGISPKSQYMLWGEYTSLASEYEGEGYKLYNSGDIQQMPLKLLNIESGEISDLKTENKNGCADYRWISDDKILIIYNNESDKWQIINVNGDICAEGKIDYGNYPNYASYIISTEQLKDLGDTVEGKFYYTRWFARAGEVESEKLCSIDVNTKSEEVIDGTSGDLIQKKGDSILIGYSSHGSEKPEDSFLNRTFGFKIFDEKENIYHTNDSPQGIYSFDYELSSDGSKVCYIETQSNKRGFGNDIDDSTVLKLMDVKNGQVKEIAKLNDFKESDLGENVVMTIGNLIWDESSTSLMFSIQYAAVEKKTITLSEKEKEMFNIDKDEITRDVYETVKNNTYIITFDR